MPQLLKWACDLAIPHSTSWKQFSEYRFGAAHAMHSQDQEELLGGVTSAYHIGAYRSSSVAMRKSCIFGELLDLSSPLQVETAFSFCQFSLQVFNFLAEILQGVERFTSRCRSESKRKAPRLPINFNLFIPKHFLNKVSNATAMLFTEWKG